MMRLFQIAAGCFEVEFWLFGQRLSAAFKSEAEAYQFLENLRSIFSSNSCSLGEAIIRYKETVSVRKCKNSCQWDGFMFEDFCSFLESLKLSKADPVAKIKLSHLEGYQSYLIYERRINASTVNRYFSTIKHFFKKLEQWELISKNPCRFLNRVPENKKEKTLWKPEELEAVQARLNCADKLVFEFLRLTGARISSVATLRVENVRLEQKLISLMSQKGPRSTIKYYDFPVHDRLREFFEVNKNILINKNPRDFVFLDICGKPINPKNYTKKILKLLSRPDLKAITKGRHLSLHGVRHTVASEMHQRGVTLDEVRRLLGHASVTTTQVYLHSSPETILQKLNKIA